MDELEAVMTMDQDERPEVSLLVAEARRVHSEDRDPSDRDLVQRLADALEEVESERSSWQATAEELGNTDAIKSLTAMWKGRLERSKAQHAVLKEAAGHLWACISPWNYPRYVADANEDLADVLSHSARAADRLLERLRKADRLAYLVEKAAEGEGGPDDDEMLSAARAYLAIGKKK